MKEYLSPGHFIDSDHPLVVSYAKSRTEGLRNARTRAVKLYYAIRDEFSYDPYHIDLREPALKASHLVQRSSGYCIEKAALLAASARAVGIPSRLQFANVINHIGTERLERELKTNLLVFHGYTELFINGKWVKATPAFNETLCRFIGVEPLEFDGKTDSIFQQYGKDGKSFMEYVYEYGSFADVPRELFIRELRRHYPHMFEKGPRIEKRFCFIF